VFLGAGDFNGDISTWKVGEVTTMEASTYTLSPPLQDRVLFLAVSFFPFSSFCAYTDSILNNALSSFFSNPFLSLDFSLLLCAVFEGAGGFNGDLSKWQVGKVTLMDASTYTLSFPLSPRSGLILTVSFFLLPFLSLDFALLLCGAVFHTAGAFNGDLSAWDVGTVTRMDASTCTLFFSNPSLQIVFFFGCFFFPSFVPVQSTDYIFEQFFHSMLFSFPKCFTTAVSHEHCAVADGNCCQVLQMHSITRAPAPLA
jgi:hypothetical protein